MFEQTVFLFILVVASGARNVFDKIQPEIAITSTNGNTGFTSSDEELNLVFTATENVGTQRTYSLSELLEAAISTTSKTLCGACEVTITDQGRIHFDKQSVDRSTCQFDIELPFYFNEIVTESEPIVQVLYDPIISGNSAANEWDGYLKVEPNTEYTVAYDVLRDDLMSTSDEYVDSVEVGDYKFEEKCQGGGDDYDCTFVSCYNSGTTSVQSDENGDIYVKASFQGNSYACDCNRADVEGSCVRKNTGDADDATWIPTKAALRFTLQKVNPIMSTFRIVDVNGAENNYANTVTNVGETCEST